MSYISLGESIRKYRNEKKMTQEEVAKQLNISRQTLSKWESNKSIPDLENAQILANIFEIDINNLLGNKMDNDYVKKKNKNRRLKKYITVLGLGISSIIFFSLVAVYCKYYSNDTKLIKLYGVEYIESKNGSFSKLVTKNKEIEFDSYNDIVRYLIFNNDKENIKYTITTKKEIETILQENEDYNNKEKK